MHTMSQREAADTITPTSQVANQYWLTIISYMKKKNPIIPLGNRVLIRPLNEDELGTISASGIIIPDTISKQKSGQGDVIAVGSGRLEDGVRIPLEVSVGDRVVFNKYSYEEVKHDGQEFYIISEENLLAVIK